MRFCAAVVRNLENGGNKTIIVLVEEDGREDFVVSFVVVARTLLSGEDDYELSADAQQERKPCDLP